MPIHDVPTLLRFPWSCDIYCIFGGLLDLSESGPEHELKGVALIGKSILFSHF